MRLVAILRDHACNLDEARALSRHRWCLEPEPRRRRARPNRERQRRPKPTTKNFSRAAVFLNAATARKGVRCVSTGAKAFRPHTNQTHPSQHAPSFAASPRPKAASSLPAGSVTPGTPGLKSQSWPTRSWSPNNLCRGCQQLHSSVT